MTKTRKAAGIAVAVSMVTALIALPAQGATMEQGRRVAVGPVANEVVREVLGEAGLGQEKLAKREERISQGLLRLVEAGIIEDADVTELVELAKQGRLGEVISERAKATNNGRSDAAKAEHKPEHPSGAAEQGRQDNAPQGADKAKQAENSSKPDDPGNDRGSNS